MSNKIVNAQIITREFVDVLHQKLRFIPGTNRDYEQRFVNDSKIGTSVDVRLPSELNVLSSTGQVPAYASQDAIDRFVRVTVDRYKMIPVEFHDHELSLKVEDFKKRYIVPAATRMAAVLEADCLTMANDIPASVGTFGTTPTGGGTGAGTAFYTYMLGKAAMDNNLAPDEGRTALLNVQSMINTVDSLKGLFNAKGEIDSQYRAGVMGNAAGFDWVQTTLMPQIQNGNKVSTTLAAAATDGATTLTLTSVAADTWKVGQVFTIAGVNQVHAETKTTIGPRQFVVAPGTSGVNGYNDATKTYTSTGATQIINIVPAAQVAVTGVDSAGSVWATGPYKNVDALPANGAAVTFAGAANAVSGTNLLYHRNAFAVCFVPLKIPGGMDMAYTMSADGISARFVRGFDIQTGKWISRMDVQYGYRTIRPELACRVWSA